MKFSDISEKDWDDLRPYLDTCLLPVTGLKGTEQPWEAVIGLERLRDALELVEIPFRGRVVTYPAVHFTEYDRFADYVNGIVRSLKAGGFRHVIVLGFHDMIIDDFIEADLTLLAGAGDEGAFSEKIQTMWKKNNEM